MTGRHQNVKMRVLTHFQCNQKTVLLTARKTTKPKNILSTQQKFDTHSTSNDKSSALTSLTVIIES